jgi:phospholipid/cholesterol/gamma-HCH transport system ATP-binding protein
MDAASAPPQSPVIEVSRLSTRYGESRVHEDVNLTVFRKEIFALAGGNGSGKSTLLREIIMLQKPTEGAIRLLGRDTSAVREDERVALLRRCGVMFQYGALFNSMTVAENVAAPLREHTRLGRKLIREIAEIKIGLVGLPPDSAWKYPAELSGGMRKRAAMARAIALDPEILFLDEPSSGLDPDGASGIDELILHLRESMGLTIFMVTHDLDSLWRVTDRVAVLGGGKVLAVGTMKELSSLEDPLLVPYFHGPRGRAAREQSWNRRSGTSP